MSRRSSSAVNLALLGLVAGSAACNSLLGISEHDLAEAAGDANQAGTDAEPGAGAGVTSGGKPGHSEGGAPAVDDGAGMGGELAAGAAGASEAGAAGSESDGGSGMAGEGATSGGGATSSGGTSGGGTTSGGGMSGGGATSSGGGTHAAGASGTAGAPVVDCSPACSGGKTCNAGTCQCPTAKHDFCSNTCTDMNSDKLNCGSCGHSCGGGACTSGVCQPFTLASGRGALGALAVNASGVYWLESNAVQSVALSGGAVTTLASSSYVTDPGAIAASSTTIYYSNSGSAVAVSSAFWGGVMQVTPGGTPSLLGISGSYPGAFGVAYASGTVYWIDHTAECIFKTAAGVVTTNPVAVYNAQGLLEDVWGNLAVDDNNIYWGQDGGSLLQASLSTGKSMFLVDNDPVNHPQLVDQIVSRQGYVYWSAHNGGASPPSTTTEANSAIYRIPVGGGTVSPLASGVTVTPALAGDTSGVYWDDGNLKRFSTNADSSTTLATGQNAGFIALDSQFIYWTNPSGGTVMKLAK